MASGNNSKPLLITFLGTGQYKEVEYLWSGRDVNSPGPFRTKFFPEAVLHFLGEENIAKVLVLVTEQAKEGDNFKELEERLGGKLGPIDIPEGKAESELWQIFDKIVSEVKEKDRIILDITHGFRSIPMIVFSVADYLKKIKSVDIEYILYGAYEAGEDTQAGIRKVPIFDLTPLLDIMEWAGGLETFLKKGEANLIGEKIKEKHKSLRLQNESSESLPKKLQSVGKKLNTLSLSLHLARPQEVLKDAHDLLSLLNEAKSEIEMWAKPFATIIDRVREELKEFACENVDKLTRENLKRQLALIRYYINKDLIIQAVLLAREWLVSYVIYSVHGECSGWTEHEKRAEEENHLNTGKIGSESDHSSVPSQSNRELLLECWKSLADLRNDLAHCGMREEPRPATKMKSKLEHIFTRLSALLPDS